MKRISKTFVLCIIASLVMLIAVSAATPREMYENGVVSDGNVTFGDARDGIVSDVSEGGDIVPGEGTGILGDMTDAPAATSESTASETNETTESTAAASDAEEEGGMAVGMIIAIVVVIAVVIIIFLLMPKRRG